LVAELEIYAHVPSVPLARYEIAGGLQEHIHAPSNSSTPLGATDGDPNTGIDNSELPGYTPSDYVWSYWDLNASMPVESVHVLSRPRFEGCSTTW
jgi:hypothetical protein